VSPGVGPGAAVGVSRGFAGWERVRGGFGDAFCD